MELPGDPLLQVREGSAPTQLRLPDPESAYLPSGRIIELKCGAPGRKQVALTFDDGPHPQYTSQLLAILDQYDVPATFFEVGIQAQKYPQWVKMTAQAGHEVGSHTYDHFRMADLPEGEKAHQIDDMNKLVKDLTGQSPRFIRPPGGELDPKTKAMLEKRGMVCALWDVNINDTKEGKTKAELLDYAEKSVKPGSIILAHDGVQATVDMLPELITDLKAKGYEFVTLSQMCQGLEQ
jgi:peptidoglycan/xylan/chitin deacetylase (PgdA/CDA1 family)